MHFEVRVLAKRLDRDERPPFAERQAGLGAAIIALAPGALEERPHLGGIGSPPDGGPQIEAAGCIQAQVPETIRGKPAAVTGTAKGLRRRRDDAERRGVLQSKAVSRRRAIIGERVNPATSPIDAPIR